MQFLKYIPYREEGDVLRQEKNMCSSYSSAYILFIQGNEVHPGLLDDLLLVQDQIRQELAQKHIEESEWSPDADGDEESAENFLPRWTE